MVDESTRVLVETARDPGPAPPTETPASRSDAPIERGDQIGRYVILDRVGSGGMGQVYAAYDPELDRKIALKILLRGGPRGPESTRAEARLLREAQAMAKLTHPNVVAVYDAGTYRRQVFIAMEFVDGITLKDWLASPRSWTDVVELFTAAGRGLAAAHGAGLVHRDFKPANVMIRQDGEVRVLDFGLARQVDDESQPDVDEPSIERSVSGSRPSLSAQLTRTGLVSGTPAYMAPEQFRAGDVDERSDQFSYCVALYEALYGQRPFGNHTYERLAEAVHRGEVQDAPAGARVPLRLRRILLRGLSVASADRFESMNDLLDALTAAMRPWRRRPAVWGTGIVVAGIALVSAAWGATPVQADPCPEATARFEGVWDEPSRTAISSAFAQTGLVYADDAWQRTREVLDTYVDRWTMAHREACEATHVRHEQSEAMLDLRMTCLAERVDRLAALTEVYAGADAKTVEKSVEAAMKLGDIDRCSDPAVLTAALPPPDDPATAADVESLRRELGRIEVLGATGRLKEALAAALPVAERARTTGYEPVIGEALLSLGGLQAAVGAPEDGYRDLKEALIIAEGVGHAELELETRISLTATTGYRLAKHEEGHRHAEFARALLRRVSPRQRAVGMLEISESLIYYSEGKLAEAAELTDAGLAAKSAVYGPDHIEIGNVLVNKGAMLVSAERYEEAELTIQRAIDIVRNAVGPVHPQMGSAIHNLALCYLQQGRYEDAERKIEEALAIWHKVLPPGHHDVALAEQNMGVVKLRLGDPAAALEHYGNALESKLATFNPEHPSIAVTRGNIADAYNKLGKFEEALAEVGRGLDLVDSALPDTHVIKVNLWATRGAALIGLRRYDEALDSLDQAAAGIDESGADVVTIGELTFLRARAHRARGDDPALVDRLSGEALELFRSRGAGAGTHPAEVEAFRRRAGF